VDKICQTLVKVAADSAQTTGEDDKVRAADVEKLEARLKEVEAMNERWQHYMEQRDKYTKVLEQRCAELELKSNSKVHKHEMSSEQQLQVDRILLEQRQKTELAEEAKARVEAEIVQLKVKCHQQDLVIKQMISRLTEVEAVRRSEKEMFEAQLTVFRDDFASEQHDRHRAQERVVNLERQLANVMQRLRCYESGSQRQLNFSSRPRSQIDSSYSSDGQQDGSLQLLIGRGSGDFEFDVRPDTPPRSH
jgi:chromosome segregation ATPase